MAFVCRHWRAGALSNQSVNKYEQLLIRFAKFSERVGAPTIGDIDGGIVERFASALDRSGNPPLPATSVNRRAAVRSLFKTLRHLGIAVADPTVDVFLPAKTGRAIRALTDAEVKVCRSMSRATLLATRQPTAWALAESGATTAEIPVATVADVDLKAGLVQLAGSGKTDPRLAPLSDWATEEIGRRLAELPAQARHPIAYEGDGSEESRQSSGSKAIHDILVRAGLGQDPEVTPASVRAWLGAKVYAETGQIEAVALRLGIRSLDRAVALIGHDWRGRA